MAKINKRIEIVTSTKRGLSSMSLKSAGFAQVALARRYTQVQITIVNSLSDLDVLVSRRPDVVFLGMKFLPSNPALGFHDPNKIWLNAYLDDAGIVCTGSDYRAHQLELNKELAKQRVLQAGLKTARFYVAKSDELLVQDDIPLMYPMFVKPSNRGGGLGVDADSLVHTFTQLRSKVRSIAYELGSDALIEEYLPGREFSVSILKDVESDTYYVMPLELVAPANDSGESFLSAQIKSADTERHFAVTDITLRARINTLAMDVFRALGARDYGRIDIRLDAAGIPHFLEANLLPSLLEDYGNFPKACLLNMGVGYEPMILQIVELALFRKLQAEDDTLNALLDPVLSVTFGAALEAI
ncbi:MAG TPA: D-alanine--D-alanine ligase [Candidatus Saccharimonadia bacterium]|nr:D-alanine--D-alanine ligase [Candidatus Saccharimonadia bacterium]